MGRYIFNAITGLSLLVCLVTVVLWVGGNWRSDRLYIAERGARWTLELGDGKASVWRDKDATIPGAPFGHISGRAHPPFHPAFIVGGPFPIPKTSDHEWSYPGVSFRSQYDVWFDIYGPAVANGGVTSVRRAKYIGRFAISYWLIVLLTLILPASRFRFRKRPLPGHCPKCHYDLRATPQRCPECGHVPAGAAEKRISTTENTEYTEEE